MNAFQPAATLIDDQPGLNFLNAIAPPSHQKMHPLVTGEDLVAWLRETDLVSGEALDGVLANASENDLGTVAARACHLGEWFRGFVLEHRGQSLPASAIDLLEPLNRLLECDSSFGQIDLRSDPAVSPWPLVDWRRRQRWQGPESLIMPVARAMAELVCAEDFTHVRQCEGVGCTLLFVDRTRARARRWCTMSGCGNRAKQAHRRAAANENR